MSTLAVEPEQQPRAVPAAYHSDRNLYLALFLAGLTMRLGLMFWKHTYAMWDPAQPYSFGFEEGSVAEHLARGLGFSSPFGKESGPTAWLAPIYPLFVASVFKLFGIYTMTSRIVIFSVNSLFGAATALTIHQLGCRTLGRRTALLAAWAWATFPIFYRWGITWVWEFAVSAFLVTLILIVTLRVAETGAPRLWFIFGGLWAVAALTNPALLSLLPVTGLYAAIRLQRHKRAWLRSATLSAVLFWLMVAPVMMRNSVVFHKATFLRGNFWFEFYLGNYNNSNGFGYAGRHPSVNPREFARFRQLGEAGYIDWAKQQSLSFVRDHPREFVDLTMTRIYAFWSGAMLPYQAQEWWDPWKYWLLSAMGLLGMLLMLTRRPNGWSLLVPTILIYPIPYYLTYPVAKYRHAIEPILTLAAAYLLVICWREAQEWHVARGRRGSVSA